jgi:glycosyltransferase involved in cell wall biosynthesis
MMRFLRKTHPDFVHLHVQHYYSIPIILSGLPYILNSWGIEVLSLPNANLFLKTLAKYTAMNAYAIIVDAKCLKKIWIEIGIPEDKIEIIPFGVDINLFNPKVNGQIIRKSLELRKNDIVVISTRPFYNDHYNVESLIRAVPLILKRHKNIKFIIKGSGPLEDYLKSLAEELNVSRHIRFVVSFMSHPKIAQYLTAADIYVSTCFIDSTSVSLLEAMACGLPPIVTDIPGNREWIENGVNGFLFPPKDPKALAEKIIELAENEPLRKRFGEKCFRIVKQRATWKESVARMEAIYKSLL